MMEPEQLFKNVIVLAKVMDQFLPSIGKRIRRESSIRRKRDKKRASVYDRFTDDLESESSLRAASFRNTT